MCEEELGQERSSGIQPHVEVTGGSTSQVFGSTVVPLNIQGTGVKVGS